MTNPPEWHDGADGPSLSELWGRLAALRRRVCEENETGAGLGGRETEHEDPNRERVAQKNA